jgi:hypothetical protein
VEGSEALRSGPSRNCGGDLREVEQRTAFTSKGSTRPPRWCTARGRRTAGSWHGVNLCAARLSDLP